MFNYIPKNALEAGQVSKKKKNLFEESELRVIQFGIMTSPAAKKNAVIEHARQSMAGTALPPLCNSALQKGNDQLCTMLVVAG